MRLQVFKKKRLFLSVWLIVGLAVVGSLVSGPGLAQSEKAEELKVVRIGLIPYFDFMGVALQKALGLDREMGLKIELVNFVDDKTPLAALARGSLDVAALCIEVIPPLLVQIPDTRVFTSMTQFKGFMVIGREKDVQSGKIKTFPQLEEELGDFKAAQRAFFAQMKGKTIPLLEVARVGTLSAMLDNASLAVADMTVINFGDDAKAATAFARGTGDFYFGSLPQQINLLKDPQFVKLVGWKGIGPAAVWYGSNYVALEGWVENNKDTVMKLAAMHYRATRYIHEKTDEVVSVMIDYLNSMAATGLTAEDGKNFIGEYLAFRPIEESEKEVYNPDSPAYWKKPIDFYVKLLEEEGKLEKGAFTTEQFVIQEKIFYELLNNPELMAWIEKPLEEIGKPLTLD